MPEEKTERINWAEGGLMIGIAFVVDAIQVFLAFTIIGYAIIWVVSLMAYLSFAVWLALKKAFSLERGLIMGGTFLSGCIGLPGWGATIWPLVAKTIVADKLSQTAPGLAGAAGKLIK